MFCAEGRIVLIMLLLLQLRHHKHNRFCRNALWPRSAKNEHHLPPHPRAHRSRLRSNRQLYVAVPLPPFPLVFKDLARHHSLLHGSFADLRTHWVLGDLWNRLSCRTIRRRSLVRPQFGRRAIVWKSNDGGNDAARERSRIFQFLRSYR